MHLRRALLLFAIVLGLAAIAASVSRPPEESSERAERTPPPPARTEKTPSVEPGSARRSGPPIELSFDAGRKRTRRLDSGEPATVLVEVEEPSLVEIPDLGLSAPAEPLTPARFEVLVPDPGRFEIVFTPAAGDDAQVAGTLVVEAAGEA